MDQQTKRELKNQLLAMNASNSALRLTMGMPVAPVIGGMPPMPIILDPAFAPILGALRTHADDFDRLLKMVEALIDEA